MCILYRSVKEQLLKALLAVEHSRSLQSQVFSKRDQQTQTDAADCGLFPTVILY